MKSTPTPDRDGVLERNVSTLLETGGEPPRLADTARARIRAQLIAQHAREAPRRSPLYAVGAGLAATAVAAVIVTRVVGSGPEPDAAPTAAGDGTTWITADGGRVDVLGARRVRVTGAALLDVAPGAPFVVETQAGTIEVLGTRFVVDAAAGRTTASVVRGRVRLASDAGDVLLHAGEQGVAEPGRTPTRAPAPRLSHLASWAMQARRRDDKPLVPLRHGTLFAREPNRPAMAETPLPIHKLVVDVVVENQVARVALDQTFFNPAGDTREGMYRFAIPPDASLQRLAMYVNGQLTESAVVERMRARQIYEDVVYRRLDPALLEWAGTGRLALRVYPLFPREEKRLLLAYTQSLPRLYDDWKLEVPLPEVDQPVGELAFDVRVRGCAACELASPSHPIQVRGDGADAVVTVRRTNAKLGDSLVLRVRDPRRGPVAAMHTDGADRYAMVRARPELPRTARAYRPRTWVILDDVSASRSALELRAQGDLVDALLRELDEDDRVAVIAFDVTAREHLAPARVRDVDRAAVRRSLAAEGGVGATSFAAALDAALARLAGVAPEDARIVYLGDGVITSGARNLDALRAQLAGRAQFIGVGVGDGPDAQTLDALAAATGGYATAIDLADDLGWRAFDLVAALHTPRVTRLDARLLDAAGALVPATVYVRSPQLADGEELELVAKLAGAGTPVAAELTGTLDGAPWTQRIALDGAAAQAGYLPRLWAHRHIAARLLAKHEPVTAPPCAAAAACQTDQEAREARDEAIRKDVVALGKRYFLLSRHTSLLVLEDDAMYKRYEVTKGAGETWAPYAAPSKIPVVRGPVVAGVANDAELVRTPAEALVGNVRLTLRNQGFGADELILDEPVQSQLVLRSRESLGLGTAAGERAKAIDAARTSGILGATAAAPPALRIHPDPVAGTEQTEARGWITTGELRGQRATRFADHTGSGLGNGMSPGIAGKKGKADWFDANVQLTRYGAPNDGAFDDLTAYVPALFAGAFERWRGELRAAERGAANPIDDAARAQLERARRAVPSGVYRWGDTELAVDAARRIGWRRRTDADLGETASFDGTTWTRRYAELGLDVTRVLGTDDVAFALAHLPLWIAEPAHYAASFAVRATGARQVTLAAGPAGTTPVLVLDFDAQDRLIAITDAEGAELIRIAWGPAGPTSARVHGTDVALGFTAQPIADAPAWAHGGSAPGVVVELPGRLPAYWAAKVAQLAPGTPAWRHAQRQRLVALIALDDRPGLFATYEELRARGGVERGDLVLAGAGLVSGPRDTQLAAALAPHRGSSPELVAYLAAGRVYTAAPRPDSVKAASTSGFVGAMAVLREVSAYLRAGDSARAVDRLASLGDRALDLRILGAAMFSQHGGDPAAAARAWDTVATGEYRNVARLQAARAYLQRGRYDEATARIAALVADLDLAAAPPMLSGVAYAFHSSRRGPAGWSIVWGQWRDKVLAGTSVPHVLALLAMAPNGGDVPRILARAAELAGGDRDRILQIATSAIERGQPALAAQLIAPIVAQRPTRVALRLAARLAEAQQRPAEALAHLEAAQALGADEAVAISTVRSELTTILRLAQTVALQAAPGSAAQRDAVQRALGWATKWRAIDPANPLIDQQIGALLLAVGDRAEAWRQLSSVIERDPMSGDGYATVAEAFEQQGRVEEALAYWQQAIVIDQTNPTPRLRRARALFALGRTAEGDRQLAEITGRRWHARHEWTVEEARQLQERSTGSP